VPDSNHPLHFMREYIGPLTIEMYPGKATHLLMPAEVIVEGDVIRIAQGRAVSEMHGVNFNVDGQAFAFLARNIKYIRNGSGKLIWKNWNEPEI
jgi:hypothetical protein